MEERHLAREVMESTGGETVRHGLSVVTLHCDGYSITPFQGESAFTIYHDCPILISAGSDGKPKISEVRGGAQE